ncbi:MAG: adenylosuccinate lyase [Acidimicrobiales bacterium]
MIPRYTPQEVAALFGDEAKLARWLRIELLCVEALASIGIVPPHEARQVAEHHPVVDAGFVAEVAEREAVTDHDVAAFVDVVQERVGEPGASWIHYGLTSSDVVDTAWGVALAQGAELLIQAQDELTGALCKRARELSSTPVSGRTHGMHAEPTTLGAKFALFALQSARDRERLVSAKRNVSVGKLSGAVGTYSNVDPRVEAYVCEALKLEAVPANQVIARDRHGQYLYACAAAGSTVELIATEIRHLARSEVGEVEEAFGPGQKGSSAMPHKRNPIVSERLCGLARVLRGYLQSGLEDVALWHERDISHSSVERIVLPDATAVTLYALRKATGLVSSLVVHPERALANLTEGSLGLVFSQSVLLGLVKGGLTRDAAYRIVQGAARQATQSGRSLREVLESDDALEITDQQIEEAFDLSRLLRHAGRVVESLDAIDPSMR